jgi:hypothetical protein
MVRLGVAIGVLSLVACSSRDFGGFGSEAGGPDATAAHDVWSGIEIVFDADPPSPGPEGAAPVACDVDATPSSQCSPAPVECADGSFAVYYYGGQCIAGTCSWYTQTMNCALFEGGLCAPPGLAARGAVQADDAGGLWVVSGPCLLPVPAARPTPQVACDLEAGPADSGVCPPPHSVCAGDAGSPWLVYYDQGDCVLGRCLWQTRYLECTGPCGNGACPLPSITAAAAN